MKQFLIAILIFMSSFSFADTALEAGELNIGIWSKVIASSEFATALAEANSKVNGKKIRFFYTSDYSSRTTRDTLKVSVVGRIDDVSEVKFQKAEFAATSVNSGMCSCYAELQKEEALSKSEIAVLAKVVSIDPTSIKISTHPKYKGPERSVQASKYNLETIEQFKGNNQTNLEIISRKTSCFVDLEQGREYVFYLRAGANGGLPEIDSCGRTIPKEDASEDLEYLNRQ